MDHLEFITGLAIFRALPDDAIQALGGSLEELSLPAGEVLFRQGEAGEAFYLVTSGRLSAVSGCDRCGDTALAEFGPGEYVGEMALLHGQPYGVTVSAAEDTRLLRLAKASFEQLVEEHPSLLNAWSAELLQHFHRTQADLVLTRLFGPLDDYILRDLQQKLEWRHVDCGEVLCRQGEPGNEMYVIVQGRMRFATDDGHGAPHDLGEVGSGECIGEFSLLTERGAPESLRSATVYATRQTDLIVITRETFEGLLCSHPQVVLKLTRRIIRRELHISQSALPEMSARVVAVVAAQPGLDLGDFARQLSGCLDASGASLFLDAAGFDQRYGKPGASQTPLEHPASLLINAWLDEREQTHQSIVYDTHPALRPDGQLSPWAQRCLEEADVILLVAEGTADPAPGAIEAALRGVKTRARLELVLLHQTNCRVPSGTAAWLGPRQQGNFRVRAHHHARRGNAVDLRRLARRISGHPIGLTLGGGGARGWAHIGAIRAIEEANIEVDWVGGASMGAIIAAGYALDWTSGQLHQLAESFSDPKKLLDYTLPYASITATKRITGLLQELYAGANIEDTWRPYFSVSANLTRGEEQSHTTGVLWKAVRASMAFPGIFAPVFDEGCVLIDGGAANNLPVDRMRELCPTGTVIGVDLLTSSPTNGKYDFGPSLSGWQVLASRLNPFAKEIKAPNLLDIVAGLVYSNNRYRLNEVWRSADLIIRVPVEEFGLLEFDKYVQIIALGYNAAREQLQGFKIPSA